MTQPQNLNKEIRGLMKNSTYSKLLIVVLGILPIICPPGNGLIKTSPEFLKSSIGLPLIFLFLFLAFFLKDKPSFSLFFKEKISIALTLFLGWCLVTILWATNPYEGFRVLLPWIGGGVTFFLLARNLNPSKDLRFFLKVMFVSGFVAATIGIFQYLLGFDFFSQAAGPASTFGNKNMGAEYIVLTLPLGFYFFFEEKKKSDELFYLFMISNMLLYVIYVMSRSAYLSIMAQVFFFGLYCFFQYKKNKKVPYFTKPKSKMILGLVVYLFFAINISPSGYRWQLDSYKDRFGSIFSDATLTAFKGNTRISFWVNSLLMLKDHPIGGVGVGNWSIEYPAYHDKIIADKEYDDQVKLYQLHNDYLEIFVSTGIIGGILFLSFIFFFFREGYFLLKNPDFKERNPLIFMALGFSGFLVFGNFNYPLQVFVTMIVLCSYAGVLVALKFNQGKNPIPLKKNMPATIIPSECHLQVKRISSLGLFLFMSYIMYRFLWGEHYYHTAKMGEGVAPNGQTARLGKIMVENATISNDLNPYSWRTALLLAKGHWYLHDSENAYQVLKKALETNPMNQTILNNIGVYALRAGYPNMAIEYWNRVIINHSDKNYVEKIKYSIEQIKRGIEAQKMGSKAFLPN